MLMRGLLSLHAALTRAAPRGLVRGGVDGWIRDGLIAGSSVQLYGGGGARSRHPLAVGLRAGNNPPRAVAESQARCKRPT
jgi:hypothetical protein